MKINWKVRFKHKTFLVSTFSLVLLLIQQVGAAFGVDTTFYNEHATSIFNTVLSILVLLGVIVDPTTSTTSDSVQALNYKEPKE